MGVGGEIGKNFLLAKFPPILQNGCQLVAIGFNSLLTQEYLGTHECLAIH